MTSYCSFVFLALYLPAVILSYQLMPKKVRPYLLLVASYALFWLMSGKLIAYLLFTTVSVYKAGKILGKQTEQKNAEVKAADRADKKALRLAWQKKQRRVLAAAILLEHFLWKTSILWQLCWGQLPFCMCHILSCRSEFLFIHCRRYPI